MKKGVPPHPLSKNFYIGEMKKVCTGNNFFFTQPHLLSAYPRHHLKRRSFLRFSYENLIFLGLLIAPAGLSTPPPPPEGGTPLTRGSLVCADRFVCTNLFPPCSYKPCEARCEALCEVVEGVYTGNIFSSRNPICFLLTQDTISNAEVFFDFLAKTSSSLAC